MDGDHFVDGDHKLCLNLGGPVEMHKIDVGSYNDGRSLACPGNCTAIARCMAPASVMVTAGIKQSGKIITAVLMKCSP